MSNTSAHSSGDFYLPIDTLTPPRNPIGTTRKSVMPPLHNAFLTALLDECDGKAVWLNAWVLSNLLISQV